MCRACRRRSKRAAHCADVHELMAIAAEAGGPAAAAEGCAGNRISGLGSKFKSKISAKFYSNPIYEPLLLSPLPCIPRNSLRLEKWGFGGLTSHFNP